jgi:hypothetical protein
MDYVPPDGPLPDAESLLGDSEDETTNGASESAAAGVMNGDGTSPEDSRSGGVKYSRLRLILQAPETIKA